MNCWSLPLPTCYHYLVELLVWSLLTHTMYRQYQLVILTQVMKRKEKLWETATALVEVVEWFVSMTRAHTWKWIEGWLNTVSIYQSDDERMPSLESSIQHLCFNSPRVGIEESDNQGKLQPQSQHHQRKSERAHKNFKDYEIPLSTHDLIIICNMNQRSNTKFQRGPHESLIIIRGASIIIGETRRQGFVRKEMDFGPWPG